MATRGPGGVVLYLEDTPSDVLVSRFFPETVGMSWGNGYAQIDIPGFTLPVYQWTHGSERDFDLSVPFDDDMRAGQPKSTSCVDALKWLNNCVPPTGRSVTLRARPVYTLALFRDSAVTPAETVIIRSAKVSVSRYLNDVPKRMTVDFSMARFRRLMIGSVFEATTPPPVSRVGGGAGGSQDVPAP